MFKDFKEFALKGNVLDMAIGVIMGGAFGKIVSSLVNDLLTPALGVILGGINFSDLKYVIEPARGEVAEVAILYGNFLQSVFDFVIIAFSIFLFVKLIQSVKKEEPEIEEKGTEPSNEEKLLKEIRDLLKQE